MSEKTDAFAFGVILVELLISGAAKGASLPSRTDKNVALEARTLVDTEGEMSLSQVVEAKALTTGWEKDSAKEVARVLCDVAASCIANTGRRQIPAQVLPLIEQAWSEAGAI